MKHIFLGSYFADEIEKSISSCSLGGIASANNKLQKNLIDGFKENNICFESFSMPQIGAYPTGYTKMYFKGDSYEYLSFLNIKGLKHFSQFSIVYRFLNRFLKKNNKQKLVFYVYDIHLPILYALSILKNKYEFQLICIIPDLIGHTGEPPNLLLNIWQRAQKSILNTVMTKIDGFSFVTLQMNDKINLFKKKFCVIEGVAPSKTDIIINKENKYGKYLFYAGALTSRNGIKNLVDSFIALKDNNYSLVLCGSGDLSDYITQSTKSNSNIYFLGYQSEEKIWELECTAFALINPRPNTEEFTKYSFPSKTMEYLATGKPVIMYYLDGVPKNYYKYIYLLKSEKADQLADELSIILEKINIDPSCGEGRNFILQEKNSRKQVEKLINTFKL